MPLINRVGGGVDVSGVTATANRVAEKLVFVNADGEETEGSVALYENMNFGEIGTETFSNYTHGDYSNPGVVCNYKLTKPVMIEEGGLISCYLPNEKFLENCILPYVCMEITPTEDTKTIEITRSQNFNAYTILDGAGYYIAVVATKMSQDTLSLSQLVSAHLDKYAKQVGGAYYISKKSLSLQGTSDSETPRVNVPTFGTYEINLGYSLLAGNTYLLVLSPNEIF